MNKYENHFTECICSLNALLWGFLFPKFLQSLLPTDLLSLSSPGSPPQKSDFMSSLFNFHSPWQTCFHPPCRPAIFLYTADFGSINWLKLKGNLLTLWTLLLQMFYRLCSLKAGSSPPHILHSSKTKAILLFFLFSSFLSIHTCQVLEKSSSQHWPCIYQLLSHHCHFFNLEATQMNENLLPLLMHLLCEMWLQQVDEPCACAPLGLRAGQIFWAFVDLSLEVLGLILHNTHPSSDQMV